MDIFEVALGLPKSNHQTACARGEETRPGFVWFIFPGVLNTRQT